MKTYTMEEIKELCEKATHLTRGCYSVEFIAASRTIVPQLVGQLEKAIEYIREIVCVPKGSEADKRLLKELGVKC